MVWSSWVQTKKSQAVDVNLNHHSSELLEDIISDCTDDVHIVRDDKDLSLRTFLGAEQCCSTL